MARRKRFDSDDVENLGEDLVAASAEAAPAEEAVETFAEAVGLPANKQAKILAKKEAQAKKNGEAKASFYSLKGGVKVIKHIVKAKGLYQEYIGSLAKHKDGLDPLIKKWKQEGLWIEPHDVAEKVEEIRKNLVKK